MEEWSGSRSHPHPRSASPERGGTEELRRTLEDRRRELDTSIRDRLSVVREERAASGQVRALDDGEVADVEIQEDIELALVQMRIETIARIDGALARLEAGQYGRCTNCGDEISRGAAASPSVRREMRRM